MRGGVVAIGEVGRERRDGADDVAGLQLLDPYRDRLGAGEREVGGGLGLLGLRRRLQRAPRRVEGIVHDEAGPVAAPVMHGVGELAEHGVVDARDMHGLLVRGAVAGLARGKRGAVERGRAGIELPELLEGRIAERDPDRRRVRRGREQRAAQRERQVFRFR